MKEYEAALRAERLKGRRVTQARKVTNELWFIVIGAPDDWIMLHEIEFARVGKHPV